MQQASVTFAHLVHLFEDRELQHLLGWNSSAISGLLLKDACTIDTHEYLEGLWNLCMHFGTVDWRPEMVSRLERLEQSNEFQDVVVCAGADTNFIDGISGTVPITRCFGRNFYYRWNESAIDQNTLEMPIICGKYLIPYKDRTRFVAGATFEKEQPLSTLHQLSDDYEMADIHSRLEKLVPGMLQQMQFIYSDGAFRALPERTHSGSIPIVDLVGKFSNCYRWIYTGLGSRGILYHAWLSKQLAEAIIFNNPNILPQQVRRYHPNLEQQSAEANNLSI